MNLWMWLLIYAQVLVKQFMWNAHMLAISNFHLRGYLEWALQTAKEMIYIYIHIHAKFKIEGCFSTILSFVEVSPFHHLGKNGILCLFCSIFNYLLALGPEHTGPMSDKQVLQGRYPKTCAFEMPSFSSGNLFWYLLKLFVPKNERSEMQRAQYFAMMPRNNVNYCIHIKHLRICYR